MTGKADILPLGRPRRGENRLTEYADEAQNDGMRLLVQKAVRRRHTLESLALSVGRDPRALARSLQARRPRLESVRELLVAVMPECQSPAIVARALIGKLSDADERFGRRLLDEVLQSRAQPRIHPETISLGPHVHAALAQAAPESRREALCQFIVAEMGLDERDSVAVVAQALGVPIPNADEASQHRRQYEAIGALFWLLKLLRLEHRTRVGIARVLESSLGDFSILLEIRHDREPDLAPAEIESISLALEAARAKYLESLGLCGTALDVPDLTGLKLDCIRKNGVT